MAPQNPLERIVAPSLEQLAGALVQELAAEPLGIAGSELVADHSEPLHTVALADRKLVALVVASETDRPLHCFASSVRDILMGLRLKGGLGGHHRDAVRVDNAEPAVEQRMALDEAEHADEVLRATAAEDVGVIGADVALPG